MSREFDTMITVEITVLGNTDEKEALVSYTFRPGQPDRLYPYPGEQGYGPEVEITSVLVGKTELLPLLGPDTLTALEIHVAETHEDDPEGDDADRARDDRDDR
mgnify:CR=1 FL=1